MAKSTDERSTRERLLDAAARVIARDGFQGARLADVAREAGLTTGAVYSNFRDKEELFMAAFEQFQGMAPDYRSRADGLEGIVESFVAGAHRFEASRQLQVLNFELALLGARNARIRRFLKGGMADTIKNTAADLPGDEAERLEAAAMLIAFTNGVALARMLAPDLISLETAERGIRRLAGKE